MAITKTIVLDSEIPEAASWKNPPANCQLVNLYSYTYGTNFLGFRHYPTALKDFLYWGKNTLGSMAHVTECGGDWTFDGPKYHYAQAFQWDVNADPNTVMTDFCNASYGSGAASMKAFWDRLEEVWERRGPVPYGQTNMRWLFYQWMGGCDYCYIQPNDEFREYTLSDVAFLDTCMNNALSLAVSDNEGVRYRMARMEEAWKYYRTLILSKVKYWDVVPSTVVNSEETKNAVMAIAEDIADMRADRDYYLAQMKSYSQVNPRLTNSNAMGFNFGQMSAYTFYSNEQYLLDEACTSVSNYIVSTSGITAALQHWAAFEASDSLYEAARTQIYILHTPVLTDLLTNGNFEASFRLTGWTVLGYASTTTNEPHSGTRSATLYSGSCYDGSTISQTVAVSPQQRYRLTLWGKYSQTPESWGVPIEATIEFYSGSTRLTEQPVNRTMLRSYSTADGWTRLRSAATVPATANFAKVSIKWKQGPYVQIDDVKFERIKGSISLPQICGDPGTEYLDADLYRDCYINFKDVDKLAESWLNECSEPGWCDGKDINQNTKVDLADFSKIAEQWMMCTDPANSAYCIP